MWPTRHATLTALLGLAVVASPAVASDTGPALRPFDLALSGSTTTFAWGPNINGSLGNGDAGEPGGAPVPVQASPRPVLGLSVAGELSARVTVYAVGTDGTLWAWGSNYHGLLGIGSDNVQLVQPLPVRVAALSGVVEVAAGTSSAVALLADGTVWAWGWNPRGRLGDGTWEDRDAPVRVQGLSDVVSIASSTAFYAVKRDGTVWTWGFDVHGLGPRYSHLIYAALTVPVPLPLVTSARSVACGATHCFAVTPDGALTAWGSNLSGELGIGGYGTPFDGPVQPTSVPGITGVVAVSPGHDHTLALLADGTVMSWGRNDHGQLGDGTAAWRSTAGPVTGLGKVVQVAAGDGTSFALAADGTVWAWGDNRFGALGTGSTSDEPSAVAALVPGLDNVVSIAADLAAYAVVDDDPAVARRSSPRRHVTGTGPR